MSNHKIFANTIIYFFDSNLNGKCINVNLRLKNRVVFVGNFYPLSAAY